MSNVAASHSIDVEGTAPYTPQMNGVVERRIAVVKDMSKTMMEAANLPKAMQNFIWPKAVQCANVLYNITTNGDNMKTPFEQFTGEKPKLYRHLVQFGRAGYVKTHKKIKTNWEIKAERMIVVGYGSNKPRDTY